MAILSRYHLPRMISAFYWRLVWFACFSLGLTISDWEEVHQSAFWKPSAVEYLVAVCWYGDLRYALKSLSLSCIFGILPLLRIVDQYILVACKIPLKFPNNKNSFGNVWKIVVWNLKYLLCISEKYIVRYI